MLWQRLSIVVPGSDELGQEVGPRFTRSKAFGESGDCHSREQRPCVQALLEHRELQEHPVPLWWEASEEGVEIDSFIDGLHGRHRRALDLCLVVTVIGVYGLGLG